MKPLSARLLPVLLLLFCLLPGAELDSHALAAPENAVHRVVFKGSGRHLGDFFGLGSYIAQRYPELVAPSLYRVHKTGVHWVREEFTASRLHRGTLSPYHFRTFDGVINRERSNGFHVLGLLDYNNTWNGHRHIWMPHADIDKLVADFVRYVTAVVSHYRGKINYWQVWNEPDIHDFWAPSPHAADYAYLLRRSYSAIKQANPRARVLIAGPSGRDRHPVRFLQRIAGFRAPFDIVAVQPYSDMPGQSIANLIRRLRIFHKPIWFTEMGWAGQSGCPPCGNAKFQARRLATIYFLGAISRVQRLFWYDFRDDGLGGSFPDHFGLVEWDLAGKPAYVSFELSLFFLDRARITGVDHLTPAISLYRLRKHHRTSYLAWNNSPKWKVLYVRWDQGPIQAVDYLGTTVGRRHGGVLRLSLLPDGVQYLTRPGARLPLKVPAGLPIFPGHTR